MKEDVLILAIESSCDETAAAVVKNGREVLSNVISSQIALHTLYGGVVPEIASRKHIEKINQVVQAALDEANVTLDDITAIGVTYGPGLVGALLVGVAEAKAIAYAAKKPLVGVHHIEGHIAANFIEHKDLEPPFFSLVVSGGHTHLVMVNDYGDYEIIGRTRDDAAGEAFDKTPPLLGEGYPGGPAVSRLAESGTPRAIELPRPMLHSPSLDMSFSGLKTAVLTAVNDAKDPSDPQFRSDLALAFTEAVAEVLTTKAVKAIKTTGIKQLVVAGGVSANKALRASLIEACRKRGAHVFFPPQRLCTDNGAMIAVAGMMRLQRMSEEELQNACKRWSFSAKPRWTLSQAANPDAVNPRQRFRNH